jgi:hypothetical protein
MNFNRSFTFTPYSVQLPSQGVMPAPTKPTTNMNRKALVSRIKEQPETTRPPGFYQWTKAQMETYLSTGDAQKALENTNRSRRGRKRKDGDSSSVLSESNKTSST